MCAWHKQQVPPPHGIATLHLRCRSTRKVWQAVHTGKAASKPDNQITFWSRARCAAVQARTVGRPAKQPPPLQLDLLPSELLGDVKNRSLQSLPEYDRLRTEQHMETKAALRQTRWLHTNAFEVAGKAAEPPERIVTNRSLDPWQPGVQGAEMGFEGDRLDAAAALISDHLFVKAWRPQEVLGTTLAPGEGV